MDHPLLILSDAHLSRNYGSHVGKDFARLLEEHRDCEVILAGDIFDLSLEAPEASPESGLDAVLVEQPTAREALRSHVERGGRVTLIPGNHDAGLPSETLTKAMRSALGDHDERAVEIAPWFVRRGGVHVEHGHLYDPDCAPNHPLCDHNPHSEGLGTALMRRFVSPHDALFFAHKNQTTLVSGLKTAFEKWGSQAPWVVADYFMTATKLCAEALRDKQMVQTERRVGDSAVEHHASRTGVPEQVIEALLRLAPQPTHHSFRSTFLRLYFDRIVAVLSLSGGLSMLGTAGLGLAAGTALLSPAGALTTTGALLSALGGGYLAASTALHQNRYGDRVIGQLEAGAELVRQVTECDLVILGHTHVDVEKPDYVNLGSFGFGGARRPYLLVDREGRPQRHYLPVS